MKKNNRAARAARFLVQCLDVVCQTTTREISIFEVLTTTRARSSKCFIVCFYMKTISAKQVQVARHIFCTAFPTWNDHRSLNLTQSSILMSPFRCSCRHSFRRDSSENVAQNCKFKFFNLFRHYVSLINF